MYKSTEHKRIYTENKNYKNTIKSLCFFLSKTSWFKYHITGP